MKLKALFFTALLVIPLTATAGTLPVPVNHTLDNGMELVLVENHATPLISCVVLVRAGLACETPETNGASHLLEHLLFNGTENRTQQQLYDDMDRIGGYNNASTSNDHATYMIMVHADRFEEALDIQTDMLFRSVIPGEKFAKEKGIVIEEIARGLDDPGAAAERFYRRILFGDGALAMPILGTPDQLQRIDRRTVLDYYTARYVPNNMVAMVTGDFESAAMVELLERHFGAVPPGKNPGDGQPAPFPRRPASSLAVSAALEPVDRIRLKLALEAPGMTHADYPAMEFLVQALNAEDRLPGLLAGEAEETAMPQDSIHGMSPAMMRAMGMGGGLNRVSCGLESYRDFSVLHFDVELSPDRDPRAAAKRIEAYLRRFTGEAVNEQELAAYRLKTKVSEITAGEKLIYYGFLRAPYLNNAGYARMTGTLDDLERLTPAVVSGVADSWFGSPVTVGAALVPPAATGGTDGTAAASSPLQRGQLANGLTLIVEENRESRAFSVHLLARNRSAMEPEGAAGAADLLHRLMRKGTAGRSAAELQQALDAIGAELKTNDAAFIPYDDYYTTPGYSFVRLVTIDEFADQALALLAEMVTEPPLADEARFQEALGEQLNVTVKASMSTREKANLAFRARLYGKGHPYAAPVTGTVATLEGLDREKLAAFHTRYFAPENLVISVVANEPAVKTFGRLNAAFGAMERGPGGDPGVPGAPEAAHPVGFVTLPGGGEQSRLTVGRVIRLADEADRAPLMVLNGLLSDRIAFQLREREGLAYSIGASLALYGDWGRLYAVMGTRPENLVRAREGIREEMLRLRTDLVEAAELEKTVYGLLGANLRRRSAGISRAYAYGIGELYGLAPGFEAELMESLKAVTPEQVRQVARDYLDPEAMLSLALE